ncbi:hypothetical protein DV711_01795 [Motiliproteus coralliicola]|uniref:DUF2029 domain-containing protein n=1 Tax=Motiliproteus coralliicola TaxID=2283196 RepID=A0A369WQI2_9GAMM|nr:hypothetical protein [Motiliproteus coralliicola]RDE24348.1 hypothetical protein DV711_01795 [Motiliproteus coralliicola]
MPQRLHPIFTVTRILAGLLLLLLGLETVWLFSQPALLGHDDALFFARGIERFSVLEFSPHFPGYPGLILLGRLVQPLCDSPVEALLLVSRLSVLLLPLVAAALVYRLRGNVSLALVGGLLCALQPLLLGLGAIGLSDGPGLLALMTTLLCWLHQRDRLAGLLLALTLCIRPGYAPLLIGPLLWLWFYRRGAIQLLLLPLFGIAAAALGFVYWHDGNAYFAEGLRFIQGHFQIWGNTALNDRSNSWIDAGIRLFQPSPWLPLYWPLLLGAALPWCWRQRRQPSGLLIATLLAALAWTLPFQNPDNLRHLAAPVVLSLLLLCLWTGDLKPRPRQITLALLFCASALLSLQQITLVPMLPPAQQAITQLQQQPLSEPSTPLLSSNRAVNLLRQQLPKFAVNDSFLPGSSDRVLARGGMRLSATAPETGGVSGYQLISTFPARFPAETSLYLFSRPQSPR